MRAYGCAMVAAGALIGVVIMLVGGFSLISRFGDRAADRPSADEINQMGASKTGDGFYVEVAFADKSSMWLGSTDGGATWVKAIKQTGLVRAGYGSIGLQCVDDGVCYLAHPRTKADKEEAHLIDRLAPDGTWRNEATFTTECWAEDLSVNPRNSDRAFVKCSENAIGYRAEGGRWKVLDVTGLATKLR